MSGGRSYRDRLPRVKVGEAWLLRLAHEEEPRFGPRIPWKLSLSSEARNLFVGSYVGAQRSGTTLDPRNTCYMTVRQVQESCCLRLLLEVMWKRSI
ncbi:hypothetical protein EUGRSUZ_J00868 [Eucalyptus grandis]|uniref:Uncharacterized protein n=2 Tax=Eucalyptus grandis TaxID=71139 RepID=A0ACC3J3B4_EUCGR|nr:hypothetical protein EUGRSUZ_J00868 [Eucalyptus grandis]